MITDLQDGITAWRADPLAAITGGDDEGGGGQGGTGGKRGGRRPAAECGCQPPRRLFPTHKQLAEGPILCGLCGETFEADDPDQS